MLLWIVVFSLLVIVIILSSALYLVIQKATYLSKKDKQFMTYVIDIYIDYAEELKLNTIDEHETIVKELQRIKDDKMNNE